MKIVVEKIQCDYCKANIDQDTDYVEVESVKYEGSSSISIKDKSVYMDDLHFCNLECLFSYISEKLTGDKK